MAGIIGKVASSKAKKYMGHSIGGKDDPYKEEIIHPNGKKETVWREIPYFIPEHDAKILDKVRHRAYKADQGIGGKFGWEGIIGFVLPEIGDIIGVLFSLIFIVHACDKVDGGLPKTIRSKMISNIVIDAGVGLIPFVGDLFDVYWKCNTKNVRLLEKHLRKKYGPSDKKARYSAGLHHYDDNKPYMESLQAAGASPSTHDWDDLEEERGNDRHQAQSRWAQPSGVAAAHNSDFSRHDVRSEQPPRGGRTQAQNVQRDDRRRAQEPQKSQKPQSDWGRLFGRGSKKQSADVEIGHPRPVAVH